MTSRAFLAQLLVALVATIPVGATGVDDLAWLSGHWRGNSSDGTSIESIYTTPEGGVLAGTSKEYQDGRCVFYDLEIFTVRDGQLLLIPHPKGQRSKAVFPLASLDQAARRATFANRQHDWPQEFVYERTDPAHLRIVLSGPGKDGRERVVTYLFSAVR